MKKESLWETSKEAIQNLTLATLLAGGIWAGESGIHSIFLAHQTINRFSVEELLSQANLGRPPFDVIAVFGAGVEETPQGLMPDPIGTDRARAGEYALRNHFADYLVFLGTSDPKKHDPAPGLAQFNLVKKDFSTLPNEPFPENRIMIEPQGTISTNTEENVLSLKKIIAEKSWRNALLISSDEHLLGVATNANNFRLSFQAISAESILDEPVQIPLNWLHEPMRYAYLTIDPYSRLERALHSSSNEEGVKLLISP